MRVLNHLIEKCKEVGIRNTVRGGGKKRGYYSILRKRSGFASWHVSPFELWKYA